MVIPSLLVVYPSAVGQESVSPSPPGRDGICQLGLQMFAIKKTTD